MNPLFKKNFFNRADGTTDDDAYVLQPLEEPTIDDIVVTKIEVDREGVNGSNGRVWFKVYLEPSERLKNWIHELEEAGLDNSFDSHPYNESVGDVKFQGVRTTQARIKKVLDYFDSEEGQEELQKKVRKRRQTALDGFLRISGYFLKNKYPKAVHKYFQTHLQNLLKDDADLLNLTSEIEKLQALIDLKEKARKVIYEQKAKSLPFIQQLSFLPDDQLKGILYTRDVITRGFFD